jgi:hypothetical protein
MSAEQVFFASVNRGSNTSDTLGCQIEEPLRADRVRVPRRFGCRRRRRARRPSGGTYGAGPVTRSEFDAGRRSFGPPPATCKLDSFVHELVPQDI